MTKHEICDVRRHCASVSKQTSYHSKNQGELIDFLLRRVAMETKNERMENEKLVKRDKKKCSNATQCATTEFGLKKQKQN